MAAKKFPVTPAHPERVCWGCDLYCAARDMRCGNGSDRTPHPVELFGEDWQQWGGSGDVLLGGVDVRPDVAALSGPLYEK
jgi:hypothetical protein